MLIKVIKDVNFLLSRKSKFTFIFLNIFLFFTILFEILGFAIILPFLVVANNQKVIHEVELIENLYEYFKFNSELEFLFYLGFSAVFFSFIGMLLSIYTNIKIVRFSNRIGAEVSYKIFKYVKSNTINGYELRKKIITQPSIFINSIMIPIINIIPRLFFAIFLLCILIIISFDVTVLLFLVLCIIYLSNFILFKKIINRNNSIIDKSKNIRDLLINKKDCDKEDFELFSDSLIKLSDAISLNNVLSKLPRYMIMFIVLVFVVLMIFYLLKIYENNISSIMYLVLIFVIAGIKLLPQIQNIFINYVKVNNNMCELEELISEIKKIKGL